MRVYIGVDSRYPDNWLDNEPVAGSPTVDIADELYAEWLAAAKAYDEIQDKLDKIRRTQGMAA